MKKWITAAIVLILFVPFSQSKAQIGENLTDWSIDLSGGPTFGQFTFDSRVTAQGALGVRYAVNPVFSLYGHAGIGRFKADDAIMDESGFTNNYYTVGLGGRANLLRMVTGVNRVTEQFGVYGLAGLGLIRNSVDVADTDIPGFPGRNFSGNAMLYRLGGGLTYRISRRVDVFMQVDLNHSDSDLLDGYERAPGSGSTGLLSGGDSYINTSAGISLKLGRSSVRHTEWQRQDHRTTHLTYDMDDRLQQLEQEQELADVAMETINERLLSLSSSLNDITNQLNTVYNQQFMRQYDQIDSLAIRINVLEEKLEDLSDEIPEAQANTGDETTFFIVAGVFESRQNAELLLEDVRAEGFGNAQIVQDQVNNFNVVTYSQHSTRSSANEELNRIRSNVNPDSWIYVK